MQPGKSSITELFNKSNQYVIPVFQRGYVWTLEKQIAPLWVDIVDRANASIEHKENQKKVPLAQLPPIRKHFMGSLVLTPVQNTFGRVPAFEVIDGQQRTTTLHILLVAFRDVAKRLGSDMLLKMVEPLTKNPSTFTEATDIHKVWPTQAGRNEIVQLDNISNVETICKAYPVRDGRKKLPRPLLIEAYLYLYHAILAYLCGLDLDRPVSEEEDRSYSDHLIHSIRNSLVVDELSSDGNLVVERAEAFFMALQNHMQVMTLTLESEDDPQVIFETLNARGEPLLASDLVRNFVFLEATRNNHSVHDLYSAYWSEFDEQKDSAQNVTSNRYWREMERQGRLTHPRIDLFFYHYTVLRRAAETKVGNIFQNFKDWWQSEVRVLEHELSRIKTGSNDFRSYITPPDNGRISEFARLIKCLDVNTFIPVYMFLMEFYSDKQESALQARFHGALDDLESYIVRRAICGYTTKNYNRISLKLLEEILSSEDPAVRLRSFLLGLSGHSQCWPSDEEYKDKFLYREVYRELKPAKVCAILRSIELASRTSKQESLNIPAGLTIEHVLPQSWADTEYYSIIDVTDEKVSYRNKMIHTFGNLTLLTQALNSSVSNGPFHSYSDGTGTTIDGKRRAICANSLLKMNAYFQKMTATTWDEETIKSRGMVLYDQSVKIWNRPEITSSENGANASMSIVGSQG